MSLLDHSAEVPGLSVTGGPGEGAGGNDALPISLTGPSLEKRSGARVEDTELYVPSTSIISLGVQRHIESTPAFARMADSRLESHQPVLPIKKRLLRWSTVATSCNFPLCVTVSLLTVVGYVARSPASLNTFLYYVFQAQALQALILCEM